HHVEVGRHVGGACAHDHGPHVRDREAGEDADDRAHPEQLDQGEPAPAGAARAARHGQPPWAARAATPGSAPTPLADCVESYTIGRSSTNPTSWYRPAPRITYSTPSVTTPTSSSRSGRRPFSSR